MLLTVGHTTSPLKIFSQEVWFPVSKIQIREDKRDPGVRS